MDSQKILSLSKKICTVESALKMINSGDSFNLSIDDGGNPECIPLYASSNGISICKLSDDLSKALRLYHESLIRDLMSAIRP